MYIVSRYKSDRTVVSLHIKLKHKLFGTSILAGLMLAAPFMYYQAGWLCFVSHLPYFYLLQKIQKIKLETSEKVALLCLPGIVMMLLVILWVPFTDVDFLASGLSGASVRWGLFLTYFISSLLFATSFLLVSLSWIKAKLSFNHKYITLILPAMWVVGEWLRSWPYAFFMAGPNLPPGQHWNTGILGFAASATPLAYSGRLVGMFGLSFMVVVINICIFRLLKNKRDRASIIILSAVAAVTLAGYLIYAKPNGTLVKVAALQIGSASKTKSNTDAFVASQEVLQKDKDMDLLVLPEYSAAFEAPNFILSQELFKKVMANSTAPIVTSADRRETGRKYNTLKVFSPDGKVIFQRDKQLLIPIGEAFPYTYEYLYTLLGKRDVVNALKSHREVTRGSQPDQAYQAGILQLVSAACSAIVDPQQYRTQINKETDIITNSASLSMFDGSHLFHHQSLQAARFIAVSNARPFVQSTKGSFSTIIDHNGNRVATSQRYNDQLLSAETKTNNKTTPYTLLGEWVLWGSFLLLLATLARKYRH